MKPISFRLPPYRAPRIAWRRAIAEILSSKQINIPSSLPLELDILLYLPRNKMINDVDNRLKDIMDALQGALGGTKSKQRSGVIKNDNQIFRVVIEKRPPKKADCGRVTIRRFKRIWVLS